MDNDTRALSGIEFERLCQILLQKFGFKVETTKQSGDGGIDLIAYNHQIFLSGKYIVQCKRYAGVVGEPIIRDLYGVVTAERANKGILITTGCFSKSAIKFASDKNIELIDGEKLNRLLHDNGIFAEERSNFIRPFTQHLCFEAQKYEFFKSMINQNMCTIEMGHDFLFDFMFKYFKIAPYYENDDMYSMIHSGFAEEYIRLFDWYVGKYYKKGKQQLNVLPYYIHKYKGIAQIYNFDLFEYVRTRYEILTKKNTLGLAYYKDGSSRPLYYSLPRALESTYRADILNNTDALNYNAVKYVPSYKFYELLNLLSLFWFFKIERGIHQVNKMLYGDAPEFEQWVKIMDDYFESCNNFEICYSEIQQQSASAEYQGRINVKPFYSLYMQEHSEKLTEEMRKIKELLDSIN